jgi:hypothetical protein
MRATSRSQRGAVLPSPVVILSIVAVALAAITFVVTRGDGPKEKDVTPAATPTTSMAASGTPTADASTSPSASATPTPKPRKKRVVHRDQVGVAVFNNTSTPGLAAQVGAKVAQLGWSFVAADNWYGTVPATTVYFPHGMRPAARQLALDLGVQRVMPADVDSDMSTSHLTLILTGPVG